MPMAFHCMRPRPHCAWLSSDTAARRWLTHAISVQVDYEASHKIKSRFYKHAYDEFKAEFLRDPAFHEFYKKNEVC